MEGWREGYSDRIDEGKRRDKGEVDKTRKRNEGKEGGGTERRKWR